MSVQRTKLAYRKPAVRVLGDVIEQTRDAAPIAGGDDTAFAAS